ncbi:Enoyl-CoA hydratase/isomerase, conserved site [Phaffia rhodozyma]|uniref:Enoyl-CoA hydratase/isomerase, conserved site n=1 Tax=Phaffia rhodozyma TaxID=264483 RepID=A0A0F7SW26_PHARH|nr:Enoyl-CoA hydratase/isomerase, conserved site [Phaffia rhodozyma]
MSLVKITFPSTPPSSSPNLNPTYVLTLSSPPDHRLTESLLAEFGEALNAIEKDWWVRRREQGTDKPIKNQVGGAVIVRGEGEKFFSNGLDFENSVKNPDFHPTVFNPLYLRLLTFPLVTIAAINGHAFAGGYMIALACDFRVMKKEAAGRKFWCCMNEIDFGAPFPVLFATALRGRVPARVLRDTLLGHRFTSSELYAHGVVDVLSEPSDEGLMGAAQSLSDRYGPKSAGRVWGSIKQDIWSDIRVSAHSHFPPLMGDQAEARAERTFGLKKQDEESKSGERAKL